MYLARLRLDASFPEVRRDLVNPYDMHRTLCRAYAQDNQDVMPRFLWRMEFGLSGREPVILVQADAKGEWGHVADFLAGGIQVETRSFDPGEFCDRQKHYRFRLLANPTVTRIGKRHGLVSESSQLEWLHRQADRHGFRIEAGMVTGSDYLHGRKGSARISVRRACFDGILQPVDALELENAVRSGIGPAKAFGCGLLSLAVI